MTVDQLISRILDAGFAPHRSEVVPSAELSAELREVLGYETRPGHWGGDGTFRWDGSHKVAVLGDVTDKGGEVLNAEEIAQAEAVLAEALRDPRVYEDDRGYLRPASCAGLYDL